MNVDKPIKSSTHHSLGLSTHVTIKSEMQKRQVELKGLQASIVLTLKDKDEKVVEKKELPANSFVLNFMRLLYTALTASSYNVKDTSGATVSAKLSKIKKLVSYEVEYRETEYERIVAGYQAWCPKEDDSHGILVGNGTATVNPEDYNLSSKIPNGTDSGQLIYLASEVEETGVAGNEAHLFLKRSFINHSGAGITVREIGLAVRQFSPETNILIIRDLLTEFEVPDNYTLDTQYTLEVAV